MINKILDFLFCKACPMCGRVMKQDIKELCEECLRDIKYIREPYCLKCGGVLHSKNEMCCPKCFVKKHYFDRAFGIFEHDGVVKKSIYNFKFKNIRDNANFYADKAIEIHREFFTHTKIDAIIPVPVHKSREQERGYNQAEVFGRELSKRTGIPIKCNVLLKCCVTESQKKLSENLRYINLKRAFKVEAHNIQNIKRVLLVDDIYTTGSTVDVCSNILKNYGIEKIYVLCISRGIDVDYNKKC